MPIYKIEQKEISFRYAFVEADNKDEAREIACEKDMWQDGAYDCTETARKAKDGELPGEWIVSETGSYEYGKESEILNAE